MEELEPMTTAVGTVISNNISTERKASCCCGQLSILCHEDPIRSAICHCIECQKRSGSVFAVQARFKRSATTTTGTATTYTRTADSGNKITFHFCGTCGSTLYWYPQDTISASNESDFVVVAVGNFADNTFPAPAFSVYGDSMHCHKWVTLPEGIEKYD